MKTLIALTGGIGVGKSYIADLFSKMGIPVYIADNEAKKFYADPNVMALLSDRYGKNVFEGVKIDFKKLAAAIFGKEEEIRFINSIIHPLVMTDFIAWSNLQNGNYILMESAILFEAQLDSYFHLIITVDASFDLRVRRLKKRYQNNTMSQIEQRMASQIDQNIKCSFSDLIIDNDNTNSQDITYRIVRKRND